MIDTHTKASTKLLNPHLGLLELQQQLDNSEQSRRQLQIEPDDPVYTQGTVDKNAHDLGKAKGHVGRQLSEQGKRLKGLEELEAEMQQTKDQNMCLELNLQALKAQFEIDLVAKG